ncbi:MAG TPA: hypothetical protein VEO54_17810 [Thermoanaerobaculia bacterium]|nr:hypothetical protein [Thermoanaerobaculia bacterium]
MTCPHLEETSARFDGASVDGSHTCDECRAFLRDAAQLRESLRSLTFEPRRRLLPILVPAAIVLCLVLFLLLRPETIEDAGPFAGLDGGGRAVITVKP